MSLRLDTYLASVDPSFTVEGHTGASPEKVMIHAFPVAQFLLLISLRSANIIGDRVKL